MKTFFKDFFQVSRSVWKEKKYQEFKRRYEAEKQGSDQMPARRKSKPTSPNVRDERLGVGEARTFRKRCFRKFIENILSVKVEIIIVIIIIATILLVKGYITGGVWGATVAGVISTVFACREVFKVARIKTPDSIIGKDKDIFV